MAKTVLQMLAFFSASMALLIAIGLAVGLALNWLVPRIELGMATLIGVIALLGTLALIIFIALAVSDRAIGETDDAVESEESDEQYIEHIVERVLDRLPTSSSRRKRR